MKLTVALAPVVAEQLATLAQEYKDLRDEYDTVSKRIKASEKYLQELMDIYDSIPADS